MSVDNIGPRTPLDLYAALSVPARRAGSPAAAGGARTADSVDLSLPATPPREAQDAVDAAAERAAELARDNRQLHFEVDDETKRVIVQVQDLDGNVIRTIPATDALDVLAGAPL